MIKGTSKTETVIDAANQTLGRIASRAAHYLIGKHRVGYTPAKPPYEIVKIINAAKLNLTPRKLKWKIYYRYTGFPGGLKRETMESLWRRKPEEVIRRAVSGMLPKNRLRKKRLKKLKIEI